MADPKSQNPSGRGLGRQLAAMSARARELAGWIGSHVLRRRAAQLVILLLVAFVAGLVAIALAPLSGESRIILAMAAGFVLFGFLLFYLGYRTWDVARRLSREAAKAREMLAAVQRALVSHEKKIKAGSDLGAGLDKTLVDLRSRQSSFAQALGDANENWLQSNARAERSAAALEALEARILGIDDVEALLVASHDEMVSAIQDIRRQQSAYVQALGATNAQMLETASKSERVFGVIESHHGRIDKLDAGHASLAELLGGVQDALASQAKANETQGVENFARLDAWGERLARFEQDLSWLNASAHATGNEISELAALHQLSIANLKDLIARTSVVEQRLDSTQSVELEQFEELARKMAMLEAMSQASQERLLSDVSRARAAAVERDAAIAAAAAELAERVTRTEVAVLTLAEQGDEPLARIATLEQHIGQVARSVETSMDELLAQLASLKEFARAEAGQVADNAVAVRTLGSAIDALAAQAAIQSETGRATAEQIAEHSAAMEAIGGSVDALSTQFAALDKSKRADSEQIAEHSAAMKAIGGSVGALSAQFAALDTSKRADSELIAQHAARIGAVAGSVNALSTQIEALKRYRRADGDQAAAQAASLKSIGETMDALFAQVVSLKDVARIEADRLALISTAVDGLGASVEQSLNGLASKTTDIARIVSGDTVRVDDLEQSFGALRFIVESSATESDLVLVKQQIEEFFLHVEAASADQSTRTQDLSARMDVVEQVEGRVVAVSEDVATLRDEVADASRSQQAAIVAHDKSLGAIEAHVRDHQESLSLLQATAVADAERIESVADLVSELRNAMEDAAAVGDSELEGIRRRIDDLSRSFDDAAKSSQGLMEEVTGQLSTLREVAGLEAGQIDALNAKFASLSDQEAADVERIRASLAELAARISAASVEIEAGKGVPAKLAEVQAALAQESGRAETLLSKFTASLGPIEKSVRAGEVEVDIVKKGLADLSRSFGASTSSSRQVIEHLSDQMTSLREAMTGEFGRVGELGARLGALKEAFEEGSRADGQWRSQATGELALLAGQIADTAARLESNLSVIAAAASDVAGEADRRQVSDGGGWYESGNRQLRADHVEQLESDWTRRLSLELTRPAIGYMTGRIATLERELDGRLRAPIEDTLLRTLIARSVKSANVRVLELGASFGVETAVMYDQVKDHFTDASFTIVSPLDSIARDARPDRQTGLQVSERIVRRNLERVGLRDNQVSLIRRSSTDMEAITQASGESYDLLIIDGDHSYAGVKSDFENYSRMVRLGGYVIFAEYGSPEWPEVQDFVDREVSVAGHTALVGASWRTAVYRVVRAQAAKPAPRARPAATTRRKK